MKCPKCQLENPEGGKFCSNCAEPLQPVKESAFAKAETIQAQKQELTTGSTFAGRYQIIEKLGSGGMGKVYKVLDKEVNAKIALKLIKPEIAADENTIERFRNELKMARDIGHKNICRMYDLNREEGSYYITMEYVSGEDLKGMIHMMGQLSAGKAVSIAKQVCEGLAEAHRLGIVHRDLKPQNIMIDKKGNARIMDFGIARSLKAKGITEKGLIIGTPEYMSPEQAEGKGVDHRSDIYSLGVILYEMLTGRVPFEGETPLSIAMKHKSEIPKDPRKLNALIPEDLSKVILICMEKDKEKRFQNAEELLSELSNIEKGIPTTERVIPKRKPITSREITLTIALKKLIIPTLVIIAVVVIGVIIWRLLPHKGKIPIPSGRPSLAVMYFENNTGDESLDHWRKALSELLVADISQSKHISVLSGDRLINILSQLNQLEAKSYSSDVLKEVAARGGVNHLLRGSYTKAGDTIRINVMLQKAGTGELIGTERVEGQGEESIFSMVDELTRRIKANFKLSAEEIARDIDEAVGKITTSSPEAYKFYIEGRKFHLKGDSRQSIQLMERALAIDPEFAMAYRSLAASYGGLGYSSENKKYLQKAFELSDRLSDRERYQIQGDFYARSEKTYDKSIEAFNRLLELYPDDVVGNNNLGVLYIALEQWDKAIERLELLIKNKDMIQPYTNLADAYAAKGLFDKTREILENYINNISDNASIHRSLAGNYINLGELDLAIAEADKAFYIDPTHYGNFIQKGNIYLYKGDLIKAEEEYQNLLEAREPVAAGSGLSRLASLYLLQGRFERSKSLRKQGIELAVKNGEKGWEWDHHKELTLVNLISGNPEEALKECDEAWKLAVELENPSLQRVALLVKGLVYLKMKSMNETQIVVDELKDMVEKGMNKKLIRLYHYLIGMMELEKGKYSESIENFKRGLSLESFGPLNKSAIILDSLALAYYKAGDLDKAQEEYEKIIFLTTGRLNHGDIFAKSFYNLGKIHEEKGQEGEAIDHYEKFLDLWKEADPGISEVTDAKKRLASLKAN